MVDGKPAASTGKRIFQVLGCGGIGVAVMVLGCAGFLGTIMGSIKSSDAYTGGLEMAVNDGQVQDALGEPIEAGWFLSGSVNVSGGSGQADLAIPLQGPKGEGTLYIEADKSAGTWDYEVAVVQVGGTKIDLLVE